MPCLKLRLLCPRGSKPILWRRPSVQHPSSSRPAAWRLPPVRPLLSRTSRGPRLASGGTSLTCAKGAFAQAEGPGVSWHAWKADFCCRSSGSALLDRRAGGAGFCPEFGSLVRAFRGA
eukprot:5038622-Alexandrium_andersonii.AAC.1